MGTIKHRNLIKSTEESLAARGFLRSQKPYDPPQDVVEKFKQIASSTLGAVDSQKPLTKETKFSLLNACFKEFDHSVPNSMLHTMTTPMEVLDFYTTPVSTTTPFDELKTKELPPNLHIQYDYVRFNPETDTMFDGITAYPESSTLVTGLKYKDKYKGHKQKLPNYYDAWSDYIKHDAYDPKKK